MRRLFCTLALLTTTLGVATTGYAIGFDVRANGGALETSVSGTPTDTLSLVMTTSTTPVGLDVVGGFFSGYSGGSPASPFNASTPFVFQLQGPLYFSDGTGVGGAVHAASDLRMEGFYTGAGPLASVNNVVRFNGTPGSHSVLKYNGGSSYSFVSNGAGFSVNGVSADDMRWVLENTSAGLIPEGVYGFSYQIQATNQLGFPYTPVDVVLLLATPGFENNSDYATAQTRVYNAAAVHFGSAAPQFVPEPSTWALLGLSLAGVGAVVRRRQRHFHRFPST